LKARASEPPRNDPPFDRAHEFATVSDGYGGEAHVVPWVAVRARHFSREFALCRIWYGSRWQAAEEARMPRNFFVLLIVLVVGFASAAQAQSEPDSRWSADVGLGWDNGISGNINSSAIGTLNGQTAAILKNKYEDVYGTGLHLRFGGGYLFRENSEARVTFTFQSLDADLVPMGDIGVANLYGQYDDYQSWGIDFGLRQYVPITPLIRGYGEGSIGLAFIDETDVRFAAPQANFAGNATDFYDRSSAFTFAVNIGAMFQIVPRVEAFSQIGLRYVSGMSEVDGLIGTGLETINDDSARWSLPFMAGMRFRF
jgi:opacity protein-like surface antigen